MEEFIEKENLKIIKSVLSIQVSDNVHKKTLSKTSYSELHRNNKMPIQKKLNDTIQDNNKVN